MDKTASDNSQWEPDGAWRSCLHPQASSVTLQLECSSSWIREQTASSHTHRKRTPQSSKEGKVERHQSRCQTPCLFHMSERHKPISICVRRFCKTFSEVFLGTLCLQATVLGRNFSIAEELSAFCRLSLENAGIGSPEGDKQDKGTPKSGWFL